jgi:hypothetical protein
MNTPKYFVYDTNHAPEELKNLHKYAAVYGTITLFITGATEPSGIVDLASMGFNYPFDAENTGLTAEQLDAMVDELLADTPPPTSDEVWISKAQANYIRKTRFPDTEEII